MHNSMTLTSNHQSKPRQQLSPLTDHDPKIEFSLNNIKETFSSKKKPIRKRNYQRRKKRFIVHSVCIINKNDPTSPKHTIETFLLQDKKPRNIDPTSDVLTLVHKKDDQHLKKTLEKQKMKKKEIDNEKFLNRSSGSTNGQFHNQGIQYMNLWNGQVFLNRNFPLNMMNFSQQGVYPQYLQYMNWTGMM